MKQKPQFRGMGVILTISLVILLITTMMQQNLMRGNMSYQEFMVAVENKTIERVHIEQNPQTPTGNLYLTMTDGGDKSMAVSDVTVIQELLQASEIDYVLIDEAQDLSLTYMIAAMMFFKKDMFYGMTLRN